MKKSKFTRKYLFFLLFLGILTVALFIVFLPDFKSRIENTNPVTINVPIPEVLKKSAIYEISYGENKEITFDGITYDLTPLDKYTFITKEDGKVFARGDKSSIGEYNIILEGEGDRELDLTLNITLPEIDKTNLEREIREYLGNNIDQYGISISDLKRKDTFSINGTTIFPPASSAKLTIAILVLRDIEAGKYSLQTTYPKQVKYIHSPNDNISVLPNGTGVTIAKYLSELISISSNTAWYHLLHMLGDSWGDTGVNQRTIRELGVNPLFLDPYQSTSDGFVKIMSDVYNNVTLNKESAEYLFGLMKNATEFNKGGVSLGLPNGTEFVNKLGYHSTPDLVNFNDVSIVWGEKTDYAVAIIDKGIDWNSGKINLRELSKIIYKYLN